MNKEKRQCSDGQSLVEVALILVVVALAALAILSVLGEGTKTKLSDIVDIFSGSSEEQTAEETPAVISIMLDIRGRIENFYAAHGNWPRSWGDYRFTDIGLDPADWTDPVEGVFWNPNGNRVGLANRAGDNIQIYVRDLEGNRLHLYDNWNIWCPAGDTLCYYHSIAPGNAIDLSTLEVIVSE